MQEEERRMEGWAEKWKMTFNSEKCKVMHVGSGNFKYSYVMNEIEMTETEVEKDLGVLMSKDLKPSLQCCKAAKEGNKMLGMISRAFHFRSKKVISRLFKSFVRPKLEYAVSAWAPWNIGDIEVLEKIQERTVKMMTDVRGDTYEERLKDAGLEKLIERRKRGDMIETFKVMKGINKVEKEWFSIIRERQRGSRQNTEIVDGVATRCFGVLEIKT